MNDYEKEKSEKIKLLCIKEFIEGVYTGSGNSISILEGLLNKLVEVKDRTLYQNTILYYWQFIEDGSGLSINSFSNMTSEKEWKDYRAKIIFVLQESGIENHWGEDEDELYQKSEVEICLLNNFNRYTVKFIMDKLKEFDVFKKNVRLTSVENIIIRILNEYRSLDIKKCVHEDGSIDEITVAEFMVCLRMSINEPDMYYIGNWKELFLKQRDWHDIEWARELAKNNYEDEDEDED